VNALKEVKVPKFTPSTTVKIATTDAEAKQMEEKAVGDMDEHDRLIASLSKSLPAPSSLAGYRLQSIEFEKDSDTNFHIDFITACSNLRARNYRIKEASKHETKFVAGKIIPAIATTTALVTGLVCLELTKVIQKKPVTAYRNSFVNLAISLFAFSEPIAPAQQTTNLPSGPWKWSLWDRIDINIGDITLDEFLKYFQDKFKLTVNMLSHNNSMLYYSFGAGTKKVKERLPMRMTELVQNVGQIQLKPKEKYLILEVVANDDDAQDVDIPYVRFKFA
jgi:ubiquitin-activating enzyme E1